MRRRLGRLSLTFLLAVGLVMAAPAQASRDRPTRVLVVVLDQMPTVLRELGIKRGKGFDGRAIQLPRR